MLVENGGLTRGDEVVLGHDLAQEDDQDPAVLGDELDLAADVDGGHRVAGRAEAHTAEPVDLAHDQLADAGPQLGQRPHQLELFDQSLGGDGTDLRVHDGVHLVAPGQPLLVGPARSATLSSSGIMRSDFT